MSPRAARLYRWPRLQPLHCSLSFCAAAAREARPPLKWMCCLGAAMERLASARHRQSCGQRVALIWRSEAACFLWHEQRLEGLCQALCAGARAAANSLHPIVSRVGLLFERLPSKQPRKMIGSRHWYSLRLHKALATATASCRCSACGVGVASAAHRPAHNASQCNTSGQPIHLHRSS